MTEINKTNLITQLDTLIATLNLSTESENRLGLIAKAAINIGKTRSSIIAELETRIEATPSLSSIEQLLLYSLVTSVLTEDRSLSVANLTALNALTNISVGSVYFVDSEEIPYIRKTNGAWTKIDPAFQNVQITNAWSWGANNVGQVGDGTTTNRSSPVSITGSFTDWVSVACAGPTTYGHSLGVRANGTLWAWGSGVDGLYGTSALGDGTTSVRSSPVSVVGGFTDWVSASAGHMYSMGLRANGTIWRWGRSTGTAVDSTSPLLLPGGFTDWTSISTGLAGTSMVSGVHNLGIRANGTLWAWGKNGTGFFAIPDGRLGNNDGADQGSPVSVVGGFTNWISAAAGGFHSLGLRSDGTLWAWGEGYSGQLGDNTTVKKSSPVSVVGGFTNWIQISAGASHNLAIRADGTMWGWGQNTTGQIGDGTTTNRSSPVSVVGGFADWTSSSAGVYQSLGIRASGTLWAWGSNSSGQLGSGNTTSRSSPVAVIGGFTDWVTIASGGNNHMIGIRGTNSISG